MLALGDLLTFLAFHVMRANPYVRWDKTVTNLSIDAEFEIKDPIQHNSNNRASEKDCRCQIGTAVVVLDTCLCLRVRCCHGLVAIFVDEQRDVNASSLAG
jgi:hypothetical protein